MEELTYRRTPKCDLLARPCKTNVTFTTTTRVSALCYKYAAL